MIDAVQQMVQIYSGRSMNILDVTKREKTWVHAQVDNVAEHAECRKKKTSKNEDKR